jgi:glycosyltransferase involved in cell wall biosynthesis
VPEPRVLHVVASRARRGAELFALDLARALDARGWPGRVAAVEHGVAPALDLPALADRWPSPAGLWRLRQAVRAVEVVVAHGSTALPAVALASAGLPVPFVYRTIGDPSYWAKRWVGVALRRAAAVTALWPAAADELVRRYRLHRVVVLPTGVAPLPKSGWASRAAGPVVAVVAALTPEKDVGLAVAAMEHLPDSMLLVAGDGPERGRLEGAPRTRFLGNVERVEDVLAQADVLLLTSRTEGLPAAAIEAGMAGVPVAAPAVGGLREIVVPGETGVLFDDRTPEAVAAAVTAAAALGRVPDRVSERYSLEAVADGWAALLAEVAGRVR